LGHAVDRFMSDNVRHNRLLAKVAKRVNDTAEHTLELPQQCRSLLEFRRAVRTPDAPLTTNAAEVES